MKYILLAELVAILTISGCTDQTSQSVKAPVSDLGHIDVILDSTTWHAIKNDAFLQKEFGVVMLDTTYYENKPRYELYLLGHLNFLHLNQARVSREHQLGGGVMAFQTQQPGQKDALLAAWKHYYKDSLSVHTSSGDDFTLDELLAWYKKDTTQPKQAIFFANLTSYSAETYKNWGITDSLVNEGRAMEKFMASWGGEPLKDRLFHSITELYLTLNEQEFKELKSALLAVGYEEMKNNFTHPTNPAVYITRSEEKGQPKYSKVKLRLNSSVPEKEIVFSPKASLKLSGNEGWFVFH
jgi:hypothetical protein